MQKQIKIYSFEQRSPEWYKVREGKITSTKGKSVLGLITHAKTKQAIDNLAMKLAIESVHGMIESDYVDFDMQRGIDMEPSAFAMLQDKLAMDFIDVSQIGFAEYSEHIGSSLDAICSNNRCAEFKCPAPEKFFKLRLTNEIEEDYYKQCQHHMLATNTNGAYHVNYCVHMGKEYGLIQLINRDEAMIALMKERYEMVIEKKLQYIDILINQPDIILPTEKMLTIHDQNITIHNKI
ncbi:MAG: YqaJ viral recombinase family protein [Candidatus Pacearchaeota archaeon]